MRLREGNKTVKEGCDQLSYFTLVTNEGGSHPASTGSSAAQDCIKTVSSTVALRLEQSKTTNYKKSHIC